MLYYTNALNSCIIFITVCKTLFCVANSILKAIGATGLNFKVASG
jgi:hypothetical protein